MFGIWTAYAVSNGIIDHGCDTPNAAGSKWSRCRRIAGVDSRAARRTGVSRYRDRKSEAVGVEAEEAAVRAEVGEAGQADRTAGTALGRSGSKPDCAPAFRIYGRTTSKQTGT